METKLEQIWSEKDIIARLNLKIRPKSGRSSTLSNWIRKGLPYFKYADRRWFLEQDVADYLMQFKTIYREPLPGTYPNKEAEV